MGAVCLCVCVCMLGDSGKVHVCVVKLRVPSRATNGRLIVTRDETMCDEFNT